MTASAPRSSALSYVMGRPEPELLDLTIGDALDRAADRWGQAEAIVSIEEGARLTFEQLNVKAGELADSFFALGLRRGDRIGIWSPNTIGWALVQFAAARAGLILVTVNPAYRSAELLHTLTKLQIRALVAAPHHRTTDYLAVTEDVIPEIAASPPGFLLSSVAPDLRMVIKLGGEPRPGWLDLRDLPRGGTGIHRSPAPCTPDDSINIQLTSGTTGQPKGATLSHRNILNNGYLVGSAIGIGAGDRVCIPVPLYHCFGMVMGNLACLLHGAAMVYPGAAFDADASLAAVAAERCTHLYGVPTMFIAMLASKLVDQLDLSTLRGGIMAGASCPPVIMARAMELLHMMEVTIAYGMTETSPVSFQTDRTDTFRHRTETVGRIQPHMEAKVVDAHGDLLPRGEIGELCTRGYAVMKGYWGEPEQTAEVISADGWMHTGDLASIDNDGYCRIEGRSKDMVIRGGENIYPREIEQFLLSHPAIQDVAVIGVPDERYGEELCAWIRLRPQSDLSEADLVAFCRPRIAHFKIPRYIRFVSSFPMTSTGKVQKYLIRESMTSDIHLRPQRNGQA